MMLAAMLRGSAIIYELEDNKTVVLGHIQGAAKGSGQAAETLEIPFVGDLRVVGTWKYLTSPRRVCRKMILAFIGSHRPRTIEKAIDAQYGESPISSGFAKDLSRELTTF